MNRDKSGLVLRVALSWDETHKTGPGSATCFCRVMDRRSKVKDANQAAYNRAYDTKTLDDGPKFADFNCLTLGDIGRLYVEMEENMRPGVKFMVRIQAVR